MAKNHLLVTGRRPGRGSLGVLLVAVVALVLGGGCSAGRASTLSRTTSEEHLSQAASALEDAVRTADVEGAVSLLGQGPLSSRSWPPDAPPRTALARAASPVPDEPLAAGTGTQRRQDMPAADGCATPPPGWPDLSSRGVHTLIGRDPEPLLAPFFSCTSPAAFVALQRRVDMARLVESLDDWSAVRLGALGPVLPEAAEALQRKRAAFVVTVTPEYGVAAAEVFVLFVLDTAFDTDVEELLRRLAEDKRLGQTLERMAVAREHLRRRGLHLTDYPDRPEHPVKDGGRGALQGAGELVFSTPLFQSGTSVTYASHKAQLPPPYRHALDEVEDALAHQALEPGSVWVGLLDEMTFGVPLGFYHLAAGVGHGASSLTQGQYEQATRELTPAALLVALYAGGKGVRALSEAHGSSGTPTSAARALQGLHVRLEELKVTAERLRTHLGSEGARELARYLQAEPQAALFVAEAGEAGALALYEARGSVPKARAWLSQAKSDRPDSPRTSGGAGGTAGSVASLVDDAAGLSREVLDAKFLEVELDVRGPRLSADLAAMEKQLAALEQRPPAGATGHPRWSEYLEYGKGRLADLQRGMKVKEGRRLEPPLQWEGYQKTRGFMLRGLAFERDFAKLLREDAARPRAERRLLGDFDSPRVEMYVGVRKPETGLRFADALVIEQKPPPGQPPRVETFSLKSRDFSRLRVGDVTAQMKADAREALSKYGETLTICRPGLEGVFEVQRVRLVYQGGELKPMKLKEQEAAVKESKEKVPKVEVLFQ